MKVKIPQMHQKKFFYFDISVNDAFIRKETKQNNQPKTKQPTQAKNLHRFH